MTVTAVDVLNAGYVRYVDHMGGDISVVNAARVSFAKESEEITTGDKRLLRYLIEHDHMSPFRHAFVTLEIKAPLIVARQWWKTVVGSDHCQPAGTNISLVKNKVVIPTRIEKIKAGDRVICYDLNKNHIYRRGKVVTKISKRSISEKITTITTKNNISKYTKEHPCVVKMGKALDKKYVLYLMKKGNSYRIGISIGQKKSGSLGLKVRALREQAEAIWILDTFLTRQEALFAEMLFSYKYGIPMTLFKISDSSNIPQQTNDKFWDKMGNLTHKAEMLLSCFGRDISQPLFSSFGKSIKTQTKFITAACNLLNDMLVMIPQKRCLGFEKKLWEPIIVNQEEFSGEVFSLSVEKAHTYIADGILTHNCMDGWNEVSRRYVDEEPEYYIPTQWRNAAKSKKQGSEGVRDDSAQLTSRLKTITTYCSDYYNTAIKEGVAPEQARLYLPAYAMYTQWRWSASLQSVAWFLHQRLADDAQEETQQYAEAVQQIVEPLFPVCIKELAK